MTQIANLRSRPTENRRVPRVEIDGVARSLYLDAASARTRAYAPYSHFTVGAALLATDGRIFTGCNVENASFGLTMCAERVALGVGIAAGARMFTAIAVAGPDNRGAVPCGACRQVLAEFGVGLHVVYLREGNLVALTLNVLFPEHFCL
jgi:cytidine deaminase